MLHPPNTSLALLSAASHTLNFNQLLAEEPIIPTSYSSGAGRTQPISVPIKLTNYSPDTRKAQPISGEHLSIGLPGTLCQTGEQITALLDEFGYTPLRQYGHELGF